MTPSPILKVLSSMRQHRVQALLMGGQACVFYGAAEFSRDTDMVILAEDENLARLRLALDELQAVRIAVPPFERRYLELGLAVHFRCAHQDVQDMRVDIMSKLRGIVSFEELWDRRTTIDYENQQIEVLSLPDLVRAKKTQRDKDWPMLSRLLEAHYFQNRDQPSPVRIQFWLEEMRTPSILMELVRHFPEDSERVAKHRQLLHLARAGNASALTVALLDEQHQEQAIDREYWAPLIQVLRQLRHAAREERGQC